MEGNGYLTAAQVDRLLAPINPARIQKKQGMSYVAQYDVRAHMNRIFGFGRWSTRVVETAFMFEEQDKNGRWKCCYRATVEVSIDAPDGTFLASYQDSHASGNAPQPDRAEAHALALTSAVSTAFKRACTNLGDQAGLSLYDKGNERAFVKGTLVHPDAPKTDGVEGVAVEDGEPQEQPQETPPVAPEPAPEPSPEEVLAETLDATPIDQDAALASLRLIAPMPDAERLPALVAWQQEWNPTGVLETMTKLQGQDITVGRLVERIMAGEFK